MFRLPVSRSLRRASFPSDRFQFNYCWRPWKVILIVITVTAVHSRESFSEDTNKPAPSQRGAIGIYLYESEDHILVSKVIPKSPAEKAGLQIGDDIRYVNNERTKTASQLMDEIAAFNPGTQMTVVIRRAGQNQILKIDVVSYGELYTKPTPPKRVTAATASDGTSMDTARRVRVLEQQISRLQEELNQLRTSPYVPKPEPSAAPFDINAWLDQHRRGENSGDPALFQ